MSKPKTRPKSKTSKTKAKSQSKPTKLVVPKAGKVQLNPFKLLAESWRLYRRKFWHLMLTTGIVAIPASLLHMSGQAGTPDLTYIGSLAGLFMLIALLIVAVGDEAKPRQSVVALYNQASGYFLRYVGLNIIEALVLLPLIVSVGLTLVVVLQGVAWWPLLGLLGVAGSLFFGLVFVRIILSPLVLVDQQLSVLQSLRRSWQITQRRAWKLTLCFGLLAAVVVVLSTIAVQLTSWMPFTQQNEFANSLTNGLLITLLLPFMIIYSAKIYRKLHDQHAI